MSYTTFKLIKIREAYSSLVPFKDPNNNELQIGYAEEQDPSPSTKVNLNSIQFMFRNNTAV